MDETGDRFFLRQHSSLAVNLWYQTCASKVQWWDRHKVHIPIWKGINLKEERCDWFLSKSTILQGKFCYILKFKNNLFGTTFCSPYPLRQWSFLQTLLGLWFHTWDLALLWPCPQSSVRQSQLHGFGLTPQGFSWRPSALLIQKQWPQPWFLGTISIMLMILRFLWRTFAAK